MRTLLVGEFGFGHIGPSLEKGFADCGVSVSRMDYGQRMRELPGAGSRLVRRVLRVPHWLALNRTLLEAAAKARPELVFVSKGAWILPETLRRLRAQGAVVFNHFTDSPFAGSAATSGWVLRCLKEYDAFFTFARHWMGDLRRLGAARVEYLPFARDPELHAPYEGGDTARFACDVGFVGNVDRDRIRWLRCLRDADLGLWGEDLARGLAREPGLAERVRGGALYGRDFAKAARGIRIFLNLMRRQNALSHNMRTFEAAACEAFVLSHRTPEVTSLFREDVEAVYFSDETELKRKIRYYLERPLERASIARAGWLRVERDTYTRRVERVLDVYHDCRSGRGGGDA